MLDSLDVPLTITDPDADGHPSMPLGPSTLREAGQQLLPGSYRATLHDPDSGDDTGWVHVVTDGPAQYVSDREAGNVLPAGYAVDVITGATVRVLAKYDFPCEDGAGSCVLTAHGRTYPAIGIGRLVGTPRR